MRAELRNKKIGIAIVLALAGVYPFLLDEIKDSKIGGGGGFKAREEKGLAIIVFGDDGLPLRNKTVVVQCVEGLFGTKKIQKKKTNDYGRISLEVPSDVFCETFLRIRTENLVYSRNPNLQVAVLFPPKDQCQQGRLSFSWINGRYKGPGIVRLKKKRILCFGKILGLSGNRAKNKGFPPLAGAHVRCFFTKHPVYVEDYLDSFFLPEDVTGEDGSFCIYGEKSKGNGWVFAYKEGWKLISPIKFKSGEGPVFVFLRKKKFSRKSVLVPKVPKRLQEKIFLVKPKCPKNNSEGGGVTVNPDGKHIPFFFKKEYFVTPKKVGIGLRCAAGWWGYRSHEFNSSVSLELYVYLDEINGRYRLFFCTGPKTNNLQTDGDLFGSSLDQKILILKKGNILKLVVCGKVYSVSSSFYGLKANQVEVNVSFPEFVWGIKI